MMMFRNALFRFLPLALLTAVTRDGKLFLLTQRKFGVAQRVPHDSQVGNGNTSDVAGISLAVLDRVNYVQNSLATTELLVAGGRRKIDMQRFSDQHSVE